MLVIGKLHALTAYTLY